MPSKKNKRRGKAAAGAASGAAGTSSAKAKPTKNALIIAIDFGTTFSGVAWYTTASKKLHHIREWPIGRNSNQGSTSDKVPSVLCYSNKGSCQWGNVPATKTRLEWFKLLLNEDEYTTTAELLHRLKTKGLKGYPDSTKTSLANLQTTIEEIPEGKKPVDLAADYLRELYNYAKGRLGESYPTLKEELGGDVELRCCLTVPAIWEDKAKDITRQAAVAAGIPEKQIHMISEPEAAAVHCLTDLEDMKGNLKVDDVYVIVDCGGGTVDLVSYQVTSTDPLKVMECTVGAGNLCGSTLLNRRFEELVRGRVGEAYDKIDKEDLQVIRDDFEKNIKPTFFPDDDDDDDEITTCDFPEGIPDLQNRVRKRKIEFWNKELKGIFEPTFTEITGIIQKQLTAAQDATKRNVDGIILVGGFGSSKYLAHWLRANIRNKDGKEVNLIRPEDPAAAIVKGAVMHGVHMHEADSTKWGIVESRKARYHYGITVAEPFRLGIHPPHKVYLDPFFQIPMCGGRMSWLVQKGENMRQGVGISRGFHRRCPILGHSEEEQNQFLVVEEEIYVSAEDIAPKDREHKSVRKLLLYETNLSNVPRNFFQKVQNNVGLGFWLIPATLLIKLESADLTFATLVKGKVHGQGRMLYHHEEPVEVPVRRRYCPTHGTNHLCDEDDEDQEDDVHRIERELESLGFEIG